MLKGGNYPECSAKYCFAYREGKCVALKERPVPCRFFKFKKEYDDGLKNYPWKDYSAASLAKDPDKEVEVYG